MVFERPVVSLTLCHYASTMKLKETDLDSDAMKSVSDNDRIAIKSDARTTASTPLYMMMVQTLQQEILQGLYPVGTVLPSESMLSHRFSVSRHTVREALRTMRESGLVTSRQGLGTIVNRPGEGQGYIHQVNTISDLFPADVETRYEQVSGSLVKLPSWARISPELANQKTWLAIGAVRRQPDQTVPFNEMEAFVPARLAGIGRLIGTQSGPIYGMIEALYGEAMGEVTQIFGAFISDGIQGQSLGMAKGDVGMEIRRIYRLASDKKVAILSFNRYLPGAFSYSMTLRKIRE